MSPSRSFCCKDISICATSSCLRCGLSFARPTLSVVSMAPIAKQTDDTWVKKNPLQPSMIQDYHVPSASRKISVKSTNSYRNDKNMTCSVYQVSF